MARVPPRWIVRGAWGVHRMLYRLTGRRTGLWPPRGNRWGALRLTATGRRTGRERSVIIAYLEDGADLVGIAMNGWADGEPAWWLNLQAQPAATVELRGGHRRPVRARAARGDEHARLWARWRTLDPKVDDFAALRSTPTAIIVLEAVHQGRSGGTAASGVL